MPIPPSASRTVTAIEGIREQRERGVVILSPASGRPVRRVLFVNNYGGADVWEKVKTGQLPSQHLWGCVQLVRQGYEVALAESIPDFNPRRRPLPHDLRLFPFLRSWLRRDDIVYCGHNVLYWIPFLRSLGLWKRQVVSLIFARETLDFSGAHSGIIALTPSAVEQAAKIAPKVKCAHLGWGADLEAFRPAPYNPQWLLHCGISGRDFDTLKAASRKSRAPIRIVSTWGIDPASWPSQVTVIDAGKGHNHENKKVTFDELVNVHYAGSAGSLITTIPEPEQKHAFGFTNLIEALALGQPVIMTKTGALADEIDPEREGCGFFVPPGDAGALATAMDTLMQDRARAEAMSAAARRLCEKHYNIDRYAAQLHGFFQSL